jgi:hypothetical protein
MKSLTLLPLLLFALIPAEPGYLLTADYPDRWEKVPAPAAPLQLVHRQNGYAAGQRPPGTFDVAYSLVDEAGRVTPKSPAVRVTAQLRDWQVAVETPGMDPRTPAAGTMWWFRKIDATPGPWKPLGAQLNAQVPSQVHRPYVPLAGWAGHYLQAHELYQAVGFPNDNATAYWGVAQGVPAPVRAPEVRLLQVINSSLEVSYSWRCNDGETALSPPVTVPAFWHPLDPTFNGPGFHSPFELVRGVVPPQGALGMHVYIRYKGQDKWHRQPAPHGRGDLWWLSMNRIPVRTFAPTGVPPGPPVGRSCLSGLHQCLRISEATAQDVVVPGDVDVCCPVVCSGASSRASRTIGKMNSGMWQLKDVGTTPAAKDEDGNPITPQTGYPRGWALWIENARNTRLSNCHLVLDNADCGIDFLDHLGGSWAMHFRGVRLSIQPNQNNTQIWHYGVRCHWHSRGSMTNDHSASEPIFEDHHTAAAFPVVVEGNQSANWVFNYATLTSTGGHATAIITQGNSGTIKFDGRLTVDNARCLLAATSPARCKIEELWIDQGFPAWVVVGATNGPRVEIVGNKINHWSPLLHVCESPCFGGAYSAAKLDLSGITYQGDLSSPRVCAPKAGSVTWERPPGITPVDAAAGSVVPVPFP